MSSPKALPVFQDQLALPARGATPQVIRQAIASQCGDVVYEILSRSQQGDTLTVTYRALPRGQWRHLGTLPRASWPLVPQEEKERHLRFWTARAEALLWGLMAVCLALAAFWQLLQVGQLRPYRQALTAHVQGLPTALAGRTALPQGAWISTLNALNSQLARLGLALVSFDFTPARAQVQLSPSNVSVNAVRQALFEATGKEPLQIAPDLWQWQ